MKKKQQEIQEFFCKTNGDFFKENYEAVQESKFEESLIDGKVQVVKTIKSESCDVSISEESIKISTGILLD